MTELPPFAIFFLGAFAAGLLRGAARSGLLVLIPLLSAWMLWQSPSDLELQFSFLGQDLLIHRADRLSLLFAYAFHLAALIAVIYALHIRDLVQQVAGLLYAGSALGVVLAGDLLTVFVFWELLALTSAFLIWARRSAGAFAAGMRYLVVQTLSGVLMLAGALFYAREFGTLQFDYIGLSGIHGWLIFAAIGIKAAFPLLHNWLTDAYPEATPTGTVFLSSFTTKVAVYMLARAYPGTELLIYIGAVMTCFPIFYAVIENDLRRVLAYSMINQVGFMVCGIGIGTAMAINGAVAHAFNDILFKGLLFMAMGAVLHQTGRINGSELGGLYKTMPKTAALCMVGAASISAFPLFSGFVSKALIMAEALNNDHDLIWLMLLFASAGVFHHAGIKIPYFAFFAHDSGIRTTEPPKNMLVAMSISALACVVIGVYPNLLYQALPFQNSYSPYDVSHVLAQMQLLFFSALAFVWLNLRGLYPPEQPSVNLDADWLYRRLAPKTTQGLLAVIRGVVDRLRTALVRHHRRLRILAHSVAENWMAWPMTGNLVLRVVALLALGLAIRLL